MLNRREREFFITDPLEDYEGQLVCPKTRQHATALSCPYAKECELPLIKVTATSHSDAQKLAKALVATDQIDRCLLGERYQALVFGRQPIVMWLMKPLVQIPQKS